MNEAQIDQAPSQHPTAAALTSQPAQRRRRWDEGMMRSKLSLLILTALAGGVVLGTIEAQWGNMVWPLMGGLTILAGALIMLAQCWILAPLDRLTHRLEIMARAEVPSSLKKLPIGRADEVGRIARAVYRIGASAIRNRHEARQIRRTLDARIESETRKACIRLQDIAMRDYLTNLGNRRYLNEQLGPLIDAARASSTDVMCIMIDIDDFKQVNDTLGHAEGDEVLLLLATLIRSGVRECDIAARLGGDEFIVLMPGATNARAMQFSQTIRTMFAQHGRIMLGSNGPRTGLSMGIASLVRDRCQDGAKLLEKADELLYAAKEQGKDRSVASLRSS